MELSEVTLMMLFLLVVFVHLHITNRAVGDDTRAFLHDREAIAAVVGIAASVEQIFLSQ